jgi:hypothetical protein
MEPEFYLLVAVAMLALAITYFRRKKPRHSRSMADITEEINRDYYADKKTRRYP